MLVVLYYDSEIEKRAYGCYILLNNKKYESYKYVFEKFKI